MNKPDPLANYWHPDTLKSSLALVKWNCKWETAKDKEIREKEDMGKVLVGYCQCGGKLRSLGKRGFDCLKCGRHKDINDTAFFRVEGEDEETTNTA